MLKQELPASGEVQEHLVSTCAAQFVKVFVPVIEGTNHLLNRPRALTMMKTSEVTFGACRMACEGTAACTVIPFASCTSHSGHGDWFGCLEIDRLASC
jgi:hypothetical protein